ncbi:hypothetical protein F5Y19DRAFT_477448 [Xylariaceae sp. FL1651]|nr:hypothetical protein F5Y19DRAFT_477448 [Xylariaceae sp. FL1651]
MKQQEEDVEASAQLMSKEDNTASNEHLDFEDSDEGYSNWSTQYQATSNHLWRRLQSIPVPSWLPIRKLNQINPRYLVFAFVVSLIVTVFIFNPYGPSKQTQHESEVHVAPSTTARPADTAAPAPASTATSHPTKPVSTEPQPGKENYTLYDPPRPQLNSKFCTTWPVDEDGDYNLDANDRISNIKLDSFAPPGGWKKPKGVKVVAMVFYGRKRYVDLLDCYLRKNLASNGGYLDEVWFMAHTEDKDDIAWLEGLVLQNRDYQIVGQGDCDKKNKKYGCMWEYATGDNTIYVKIDDDIIYIHPDTIPQLVHTRLAVPHAFGVSAHLINSPITGMEQFHHNAIYPFVPDPNSKPSHQAAEEWRLSGLDKYPKAKLESLKKLDDHHIKFPDVPYRGHPFVLLSEDNFDLLHTSMGRYDQAPGGDFIAFSPVWKSWAMAAQQQYSLLYNLEKNQISRYFFGKPATYPANAKGPDPKTTISTPRRDGESVLGGEQIFDTQFRRYNLNFVAVWGSDIKKHLPIDSDDEEAITSSLPKKTGRPFIIDTRAVVAHFSFFTQAEEIRKTDLLDRWRAFANEAVCERDNLKKPWDLRCPKFKDNSF